jgi:trk system potassium uptake protein TrkA
MKRIGVIGTGRFGYALCESLCRRGAEVVVMDDDKETVQRVSQFAARSAQGDASDIRALTDMGFQDCDAAVVAIGTNMEGSILATMNLKELGVPYIVAKAGSDLHGKVLERVGADLVVYPNRERAQRLARSLLAGSAVDYFEISEGVSVVEMAAPPGFVGKSLIEADIRRKHNVTVLAIRRPAQGSGKARDVISPSGDDVMQAGDTLILFGPDESLDSLS